MGCRHESDHRSQVSERLSQIHTPCICRAYFFDLFSFGAAIRPCPLPLWLRPNGFTACTTSLVPLWICAKKMLDTNAGLCYNAPRSQELQHVGEWCNGSTCDSDSYSPGSSPGSPALLPPLSSGLGRRPLKAETPVRIWLEVVRYDLVVRSFFFILFSPFHPRLHSCTIGRDYS